MFNSIAKIQTWGTEAGYNYGVRNYLSASIRLENVGHAAIELQFPVTEQNNQLITQYCAKIPHQTKTIINTEGQKEDIHIVRFSFVPDSEFPFRLMKTYSDDCLYEHSGHQTTSRHALEVATFPERKGQRRNIKVFQASTLTPKGRGMDFFTSKGKCVLNIQKARNLDEQLKTAKILYKKLGDKKAISKKKDTTIFLAANALNIVLHDREISSHIVLEALEKKVEEITTQLKQLEDESNHLIPMLEKEGEFKLIEGLSAQHKSSQSAVLQNSLELASVVLQKAIDLSKQENTNKEELISSMEQLIKDKPILNDPSYGFSQFVENLSSSRNEPGIDITEIKNAIQNFVPEFAKVIDKEMDYCERDIEKSNDITNWNLSDYLCAGRPPDGEVTLSIDNSNTDNKENRRELHLESMLRQMQQIADSSHPYQLLRNNCSVTVMSIINAGMNVSTHDHKPTSWYQPTTPQMIFNKAIQIRDRFCKQMTNESLVNLDQQYASHSIIPLERQSIDLDKAIISFAVDTIFPDEKDVKNDIFYRFPQDLRGALERQEQTIISTELLHDLWGIVPERSLPIVKDGSLSIPIDQNLTISDLMQGLTVLAAINAGKRLTASAASANADTTKKYKSAVQTIKTDTPQPVDEANVNKTTLSQKFS